VSTDDFDIEKMKAEADAERAKLDAGMCLDCGKSGTVTRRVDPRQDGEKGGHPGAWVNYRCPCGFARDYVESIEPPN
jgi:hypothetical protein